jgi:type IV pilus assembly protein PilN
MRISINLASRPFVELRPLFARLRIAMAALAVLAIGLGFGLHALNAKAKVATAQMDALRAKTTAVERQRAANEARMRQPDNMSVLERSRFLNALFASKSFSWTAVMMDLERVLPGGVQVTSIDPVISKEGDVSIRLRVTGDRDKAIQLVRNLETSQRFVSPRLGGETALTAEKASALGRGSAPGARNVNTETDALLGNGVEFEIFSGYNPLPEKTETGKREEGKGKSETKAKAPVAKAPAVKLKPVLPSARPVPVPAPVRKPAPAGGAR